MYNGYEHLSRDARIARLGHYMSKMVTLMVAADKEAARIGPPERTTGAMKESDLNDRTSQGIVDYLKRVHCASPRDMVRHGEVKRSSCFRRLKELRETKVIETVGYGKGVQYRLATDTSNKERCSL